jgi:uncharacterized protein YndB with AHSA1/START domain
MSVASTAGAKYSVQKTVTVETSADHAFRVFTEKHGAWWPLATHHIGKHPARTAIIEPAEGGRWYEQGEDGSECDWGRVLVWDPPHRLVLAWQLTAEWQFDPSFVTEVELRFISEGAHRTRVEFEHRNLEAYGPKADTVREMIGAPGGWPAILDKFVDFANEEGRQ